MPTHELTVAESGAIKVEGTTLAGVMAGVHRQSSQQLIGAVSQIDFNTSTVRRFELTGNITGAFANPPVNVPPITTNNYRLLLVVEFVQDSVGGKLLNLSTLFANYTVEGVNAPNLAPNGVTQVLIVAQRVSDTVSYTVYLPSAIDGAQIATGFIDVARIQDASTTQKGVIQIGGGPGGAAAGNHIHAQPDSKPFRIARSDGSTIVNGISDLIADVSFAGEIVRLAKVMLQGDVAATATVELRIDTSPVTGAGGAITNAASADMVATGSKTFNERQAIRLNVTAITGTPNGLIGVIHYLRTGLPPT